MTYDEFISIITSKNPSLEDYKRAVAYVESADIETLRAALNIAGIHPLFIAVINKSLQEKVTALNLEISMQSVSSKLRKGP